MLKEKRAKREEKHGNITEQSTNKSAKKKTWTCFEFGVLIFTKQTFRMIQRFYRSEVRDTFEDH